MLFIVDDGIVHFCSNRQRRGICCCFVDDDHDDDGTAALLLDCCYTEKENKQILNTEKCIALKKVNI